MRAALLLLIVTTALLAQPTSLESMPGEPAPSPLEVAQAFQKDSSDAAFTRWMTRLGLPQKLDSTRTESEDFDCDRSRCSAQVIQASATALIVSSRPIFRIIWMEHDPRTRSWTVRGHLDGRSHYGVTVRFFSRYLLVETTGWQGFPSNAMVQCLYEPRDGKLVSVLDLPARGHDAGSALQPNRRWNVTPVDSYFVSGNPERIDVYARLVLPDNDDDAPHLADQRRTATYLRPPAAPAFTLDPQRSDLTQPELDDLFRVHDGSIPDPTLLLAFTRTSLLRLARTGTAPHRRWLSAYLAQAPASPAKSQLLRALPASRPVPAANHKRLIPTPRMLK